MVPSTTSGAFTQEVQNAIATELALGRSVDERSTHWLAVDSCKMLLVSYM